MLISRKCVTKNKYRSQIFLLTFDSKIINDTECFVIHGIPEIHRKIRDYIKISF